MGVKKLGSSIGFKLALIMSVIILLSIVTFADLPPFPMSLKIDMEMILLQR